MQVDKRRVLRGRGLTDLFIALVLSLLAASCQEKKTQAPSVIRGRAMGTTWQVTLNSVPPGMDRDALQKSIAAVIERIEAQMSHWRPESVVSRFNQRRSTRSIVIPLELADVVEEALRVHRETEGAFDITVAPLVELWGFGPGKIRQRVPSSAEITAARSSVGSRLLVFKRLASGEGRLAKKTPDVRIDLSAIAKGYALDAVAKSLDKSGAVNYLIELGGELRAKGARPDGGPWRVGLEAPDPTSVGGVRAVVELKDAAIATTGNYRKFFKDPTDKEVIYSHVLDPRTGRPVTHRGVSVSIIAKTAMRADALATALMVMGPKKGLEFAEKHGLAAAFVTRTAEGLVEKSTQRFRSLRGKRNAIPRGGKVGGVRVQH